MAQCIKVKADAELKNYLENHNVKYAVLITRSLDTLIVSYSLKVTKMLGSNNYAFEFLSFIPSNISNDLN